MRQTILSVEGDAAGCEVRNAALREAGYEVYAADPESDIPALAAEEQPTLILLPTALPKGDGFTLCRQLKRTPRTATIPILHISGANDYPESLESGANGYVAESISMDNLAATVAALIRWSVSAGRVAEPAPLDSERIYRAIGESTDYGVWVCTPDGRNTYASESFLKLVGLTQE